MLNSLRLVPGLLFAAACLGYAPVHSVLENPQALVRQVVENEIQARAGESICWSYLSQTKDADACRTELVIETPQGTLKRLLAQNGHLVTPMQAEREDQRIQDLIRNPHNLDKQVYENNRDQQEAQSLFKMLPEALIFTRDSEDGETIRLSYRPNPDFVPRTYEAKILHLFQGVMLVDSSQKRLVELRGEISRDLGFGWGIFGKLNKGGTFVLRQEQVESGRWVITSVDIQVTGRVWFFRTIGKQSQELYWAFQRVPKRITLEDAAKMAKKDMQEMTVLKLEPGKGTQKPKV